jgi:hypothetical protein
VYEILNETTIVVWSIGKREEEIVYINTFKRKIKEE